MPEQSSPADPYVQAGQAFFENFLKVLTPQASGVDVASQVKALGDTSTRLVQLQGDLYRKHLSLWQSLFAPAANASTAEPVVTAERGDRRFSSPEWSANPYFDYLRQTYLLNSRFLTDMVEALQLEPQAKERLRFATRQFVDAMSPANFAATNPEALKLALETQGESLTKGIRNLIEDVAKGRISMTDESVFEVGRNIAITPGSVVFENELIQLIQYGATTPEALKIPLLIVPPWINKFYILDLTPEKSFIRWCVDQGVSVFVISWVNPDARVAAKSFEEYMRDGVIAAMDAVTQATGEKKMHSIGYCVGGTLLAITLAWLAAKKQDRVASCTLFTAQVDFTYAGDLAVFVDEERIKSLEEHMKAQGYLEASRMATAFNMLRSNDLIWPYVVNNYLRGKKPYPFDILYWNSDATRMPAANHSFYLRNCYLENRLAKGEMEIAGVTLDLKKVKVPIYNLATREDHIAPATSVLYGSQLFGGDVKYVLAGSGHIAGVVNPPAKPKYQHWTGGPPKGSDVDAWVAKASEHPGSWWPDWLTWLKSHDEATVPARKIGGGKLKAIEDAPGSYVKVRSWT